MLSSTPRRAAQSRSQPVTQIPTVCVVDPRVGDYQGWNAMGEARGLQLKFLTTAAEALRLARGQIVDLWVINSSLPGLSGHELCGMLKDRQPRAAVYLVANQYTPEAERQALRHRATLFGCKGGHIHWLDDWLQTTLLATEN